MTCFGCGKKGLLISQCPNTMEEEMCMMWNTKKKEFQGKGDDASTSTKKKASNTMGVEDRVEIARNWSKLNKCVTLMAHGMFVTRLPILCHSSKKYKIGDYRNCA